MQEKKKAEVTWEGRRWCRCGHSYWNSHAATAAVLSAAAATATGMAATTAATADGRVANNSLTLSHT